MKNIKLRNWLIIIASIALVFIFSACEPSTAVEKTDPGETNTETPPKVETEIPPTLTPTQDVQKVILISEQGGDELTLSQVQSALETLTAEAGYALEILDQASLEAMTDVLLVVSVGEDIDVNSLAQRSPEVSFVAVDNGNAVPSGNVHVIGDPIVDQQNRAFMAGYLAALISEDYKVAALVPSEIDATEILLESFVIGARFFCGLCQPKYPPYQSFPQWQTIPVENLEEQYQSILDNFINSGVEVLYIQGDLAVSPVMNAASEYGMTVLSDQSPEVRLNNYAGTIVNDPGEALIDLWPEILNGRDGSQVPAPIILIDRNPNIVSEGRYLMFLEMAENLQNGLVSAEASP
jgi:basic membrane lipoprotein Med (substrate-binding protein (PBP1-ABC) superfamily)